MNNLLFEANRPRRRSKNQILFRKQRDPKHFKCLRKRQNQNRFYTPDYDYSQQRTKIWFGIISKIIGKLDYSLETFYAALSIFDSISSRFNVADEKMVNLCLVCVDLAAKIRESKQNVKDLVRYREYFGIASKEAILELQKSVITILDYKLDFVLPLDVLMLFLKYLNRPQIFGSIREKSEQSRREEELYLKYLYVVERVYEFKKFSPVAIASAIFVCVQKKMGFDDLWPVKLLFLTNIEIPNLKDCMEFLEEQYPQNCWSQDRGVSKSKRILSIETQISD